MDKGLFIIMIILDLQKAFDMINHTILLSKLKFVGLKNILLGRLNPISPKDLSL